jgi:hypothetical protein
MPFDVFISHSQQDKVAADAGAPRWKPPAFAAGSRRAMCRRAQRGRRRLSTPSIIAGRWF